MVNQGIAILHEQITGSPLDKNPSLAISQSMAPLGHETGIPPVDVVMDLLNLFWFKDQTKEVNLAAITAMGTVGKFFNDVYKNFRVHSYDTPEAMQMVLGEYAEMSKGFTNLEHAYYMYKFGEAVNREGMNTGVRASYYDAFGRIFGNRMKEELAAWQMFREDKAEKIIIKNRANEIFSNIIKYDADGNNEEYLAHATQISKLLSLEKDSIRNEIFAEVDKKLRKHLYSGNQKESLINNYYRRETAGNTEAIDKLRSYLMLSTDSNDKRILDRLNATPEVRE